MQKINKINPQDPEAKSADLIADNIQKLKQLFPEVVAEGKIDFTVLQDILGEEIETGEEYYRFTWAGKARARQEAHKPSTGTLRPCREDSKHWDTTQNLYLEGDNLEVLKLLQKSYANKIKMIYIDPPYNTGKDFVYKDNYKDNLGNYLEQTGQVDAEGRKLSTNSDSDGRYHSNWLNMIYPRLRLARNLLSEDGVIFMSIDDNEVENLKKVGNEVFGEENFVANIVWHKRYAASNDAKGIPSMHDHILLFQKTLMFNRNLLPRTDKQNSLYKYDSNDGKGRWRSDNLTVKTVSESYLYKITNPNTGEDYSPTQGRCWLTSEERMKLWIDEGRVFFGQKGDGAPQLKRYLSEVQDGVIPNSLWSYEEVGHTDSSRKELKSLFETSAPFDNPKPTKLIDKVCRIATDKNDIILDFFSGSATTAHAVMKLNAEDGGQRKHIQVQLPEATEEKSEAYKAGYKTIADIGKERIRRAGEKIVSEKLKEKSEKEAALKKEKDADKQKALQAEIDQLQNTINKLDIGFKVFKLDTSNIKAWDGESKDLEAQLFDAIENIKADRTEEDVLYEILLKYGLDLTLPIEEKTIADAQVYCIGAGAMFICLSENITAPVATGIGQWKEELEPEICRVIFRDSGFSGTNPDAEKTNALQELKRFGVSEVRSI